MSAAASPAPTPDRDAFRREFVDFAIRAGALRFGEFKTKAGRLSPYFFNAGLFCDGERLGTLAQFYARAALASGIAFDVITDGASKREAIEIIRAAGATPAGVLIALDRQERGQGELSATEEVSRDY